MKRITDKPKITLKVVDKLIERDLAEIRQDSFRPHDKIGIDSTANSHKKS